MKNNKRLTVVGATGMIGGYALNFALEDPGIERVTTIGRRPVGVSHRKLKEVPHQDFADCSSLGEVLSGQDAVVYCLGAYTGAVSDQDLRKITVDFTVEFAWTLKTNNPGATFSFLSGMGADPTGRSRVAFARYKGEAEKALLAMGFPHLYIFRPAYIYPVKPRKEPNFGYQTLRWAYPAIKLFFPSLVIPADDLAKVMVDVAVHPKEGKGPFIENRDIQAMAGRK